MLIIALTAAIDAADAETQTPSEIQRTVDAFVRAQTSSMPGRVETSAGALDPRLKLPHCEALEAFLPPGARLWGNSTVGVRCTRPQKWQVYVPVQVSVWNEVVVTTRALERGQTLGAEDMTMQTLDLTQLPQGVYADPGPLAGKLTRVRIGGGVPLRPDMLRSAPVVLHGDTVRIVYAREGIHVMSEARAMGSAGVGESVQVRTASGKVLKGVVQAPGVVELR